MIGSGSLQCIVGKLTLCTYERQLLASLPGTGGWDLSGDLGA